MCRPTLRDIQKVLREDKERLRQMQKRQPHFSSDQRRELVEEHPWMRRGGLPAAINVTVRTANMHACILGQTSEVESLMSTCLMSLSQECVYCEDAAAAPLEEDLHDMDMGPLGEEMSQENQNKPSQSEMSQPQQDAGS